MEENQNLASNTVVLDSMKAAALSDRVNHRGGSSPGKKSMTVPILIGGAVVILAALGFIAMAFFREMPVVSEVNKSVTVLKEVIDPFFSVNLEAKAAYVYDLNTGKVLYEKNGSAQLPLASLTKLMTAVVGSEEVPLYTLVPISPSDLREEGDSGLITNEKWRLDDLIKFTLTRSSNDGASAIATVVGSELIGKGTSEITPDQNQEIDRTAFVALMNKKSNELNMTQTFFLNPTGLDHSETESGGYGSAQDVVTLFSYLFRRHPELIKVTGNEVFSAYSTDEIRHTARNTNPNVKTIPGLIGSKTGYTDLAGGNLVIAFDAGITKPVIIAVLGSTEAGRFEDVEKLYWAALEKIGQGN